MNSMSDTATLQSSRQSVSYSSFFILGLCALFLFYKYILQNFPSVMAPQIMDAFHLQGLGLGMLSSVYFWTYLLMPLFVGLILDYYGAKWITTLAIMFCAVGVFLFANASTIDLAIWGRALIGVGVSFAAISYFKLAAVWFAKEHYALLTSLLFAAAMIGAVFGQMPLAYLVQEIGWRDSLSCLGFIGIALAVLFVLFVHDKASSDVAESEAIIPVKGQMWKEVVQILKDKQNWLLTGYNGLAFAPLVVFCGLWGNPFLQSAYSLDKLSAASYMSLVFLGLCISAPLMGMYSAKIRNRLKMMQYSALLSATFLTLILYAHPMPTWLLGCFLFLFGFSLGALPLVFVIGKEINPLYLAGTAISLINSGDALLDAVTEPLIGKILDSFNMLQGSGEFSLTSYHIALAILPLYQVVGAFLLRFVKVEAK